MKKKLSTPPKKTKKTKSLMTKRKSQTLRLIKAVKKLIKNSEAVEHHTSYNPYLDTPCVNHYKVEPDDMDNLEKALENIT